MQYLYTVILLPQYLRWVLLIRLIIYSNTHTHTHPETVSCRFFWRMIAQDCNIVAPPPRTDDDTAGGNNVTQQSRSQSESSTVLLGSLQSGSQSCGHEQGQSRPGPRGVRPDLQPHRHADISSLFFLKNRDTGRQQDSVWLGFVRFSSGNTTKKKKKPQQVSWWLFKLWFMFVSCPGSNRQPNRTQSEEEARQQLSDDTLRNRRTIIRTQRRHPAPVDPVRPRPAAPSPAPHCCTKHSSYYIHTNFCCTDRQNQLHTDSTGFLLDLLVSCWPAVRTRICLKHKVRNWPESSYTWYEYPITRTVN